MVFTDGQSDLNLVKAQSRLLHPLVDAVYAFGIGEGIFVPELEAIASEPEYWSEMKNFQDYREFVRLFMLGLSEGCSASIIQPYRIIDLGASDYLSPGVSDATADFWNAEYPNLECSGYCPDYPENGRGVQCAECSERIAALDLEAMEVFRQNITEAANEKCFNAALLAGFISRQTQGGKLLQGTDGWIPCDNDDNGNCYGIMHMNNISTTRIIINIIIWPDIDFLISALSPITNDGIGGIEYLKDGIGQLIQLIDTIVENHSAWGINEQTRGGIGLRLQHC